MICGIAQSQVYNQTNLTIQSGLTVTAINGWVNEPTGIVDNQGILAYEGTFSNHAVGGGFSTGTGEVIAKGTSTVIVGGTEPANFNQLSLTAPELRLETGNPGDVAFTVEDQLNLGTGKVNLFGRTLDLQNAAATAIISSSGALYDGSAQTSPYPNLGKLRWRTGAQTGVYTVPFIDNASGSAIPVTLNLSVAGDAAGYVEVSTYKASFDNLPYPDQPLVGNLGLAAADNSNDMINRFWRIDASSYTTQPSMSASLAYLNDETCIGFGCGTTIPENRLALYRWDESVNNWDLNLIDGTTSATTNTYTSVAFSDADGWFVLADRCSSLVATITNPLLTCSPHTLGVNVIGNTGVLTYNWLPTTHLDNATASNPVTTTNEDITYTVTVTDQAGCTDAASVSVDIAAFVQEICVVTVDSATSTHNIIVWDKTVSNAIDSFKVYRRDASVFNLIGKVHYDSLSLFKDFNANPNMQSYYYKISTLDTCGIESPLSTTEHRSMHLQVNQGFPSINLLWNDYEGNTVDFYRVWRDSTGLGGAGWHVISSTVTPGGSPVTFTDLTPPQNTTNLQYVVESIWMNNCTATRAINHNTTRSNKKSGSTANSILDFNPSEIIIFPNPNSGSCHIQAPNTHKVLVYDATGKLVENIIWPNDTAVLDLKFETSGLYHVILEGAYGQISRKIAVSL